MPTQLEIIAEQQRKEHLARNYYDGQANGYSSNHPNAKSNGDEKGKGENEGNVGSSVDIQTRTENMVKNYYQADNPYGSNHPNAKSDGDERGKGENEGSVGSKTDIGLRVESLARNKYNTNKGYPDF